MRLLNWGAVAVVAIAFAGSASAQDPYSTASRGYVMSAPTVATPTYAHNGHTANFVREAAHQSGGLYWSSHCQNGINCNSGSGSFVADFGFAFGPSSSFFAPCGPRVLPDCRGRGDCHKCRTPIYGRGPVGPFPTCVYDSFMNH